MSKLFLISEDECSCLFDQCSNDEEVATSGTYRLCDGKPVLDPIA